MKITALILAGGKGERFWPRSRKNCPKQFLSLTGDGRTMIQKTVERILPLVKPEDIFISTNQNYKKLVLEQLSDIPEENILCEPVGRNTAPGIGLGAVYMRKKYEDAVMLVLPSDHLIKDEDTFRAVLSEAIETAEEEGSLVTMGITPTAPETGYGYIRFLREDARKNAYKVERFVEKPDLAKAKEYLADGGFLWNSGMFVWKVSTILGCIERHLPKIYSNLAAIEAAIGSTDEEKVLNAEFDTMPSESIDYGVLEKEDSIRVLPGDFGWDDVGSWLALGRMRSLDSDGNLLSGNTVTTGVSDCIIEGGKKLIAAVGVKDLVIVDTDDAILICNKENTADIKKIVENLRNGNGGQYL